jgi:hypothetical protein
LAFVETPTVVGDDPARRCPDIRKAQALVGWEPEVTLEEGLRRTIPYFKRALSGSGVRAETDYRPVGIDTNPGSRDTFSLQLVNRPSIPSRKVTHQQAGIHSAAS